MADTKISALPASTTPLTGAEVLPVVQSSVTKQVSIANLTAGRNISTQNITAGSGATSVNVDITLAADTGSFILRNNRGGHYLDFVDSYGYTPLSLQGGNSVITGNLVQGTAARGVNFTANTPAAGMTSQLLNWYEEGTWTPTYVPQTGAFGAITYNTTITVGRYTRIGNMVYIQLGIRTDAITVGTASGFIAVGGFPFTSASGPAYTSLAVSFASGFGTNTPSASMTDNPGTKAWLVYRTAANGGTTLLGVTDLATGSTSNVVYISGSYRI